jgi:hypothetical protein
MSALFSNGPDTSLADKAAKKAEALENSQARELAARRRTSAGGNKSKTLFSQVLGTDEAIGSQTKLGE